MATDGEIPINPGDLPTEAPTLEESAVYTVTLEKAAIAMKVNKSGNMYCSLQTKVAEGDYEGMTLMQNHLELAVRPKDGSNAAKIKAQIQSAPFARFCASFGIKEAFPVVSGLDDREAIEKWQDWVAKSYGNRGKVTVRNQEFPPGSGRLRSGINDYVI